MPLATRHATTRRAEGEGFCAPDAALRDVARRMVAGRGRFYDRPMMLHTLAWYPDKAPRRKFRGRRRYFRAIQRKAEAFRLQVAEGSWWNLWHYHADWRGQGNRGWRSRREHLRALCSVFRQIVEARFPTPFQAWLLIDGEDAGQDAVYLHTPNPHGTPFPLIFPQIEWGTSALAPHLRELLLGLDLQVGYSRSLPEEEGTRARTAHWVRARGVGEAITAG